jgi:transcriptional regulator GlxA family with amidase domain
VLEPPDHAFVLFRPAGRPAVLRGPRTTARYHPDGPGPVCDGSRLAPGHAAGLVDRPLRELVDREVTLGGPPALREHRYDDLVHAAAAMLSAGEPWYRVARGLHVSERHLRTVFTAATGLTPTAYVRLDRVRAVLAAPGPATARYYDQSHLIAEFRRVVGVPPGAYAKGLRPPAAPCPEFAR